MQTLFFDKPGFQPRVQDRLFHGNVRFKPCMGDLIEARFDVAFENPFRPSAIAEDNVSLFNRVGAAAFLPEPIGVRVLWWSFNASAADFPRKASIITASP
jgi:hypothetical protein